MSLALRKRIIKISASVLLFAMAAFGVYHFVSARQRKKEEIKITKDINSLKLIKYKDNTFYSDLQILFDIAEKKHSDAFKGFIYERISFVYKCMGDELQYYTYLGKALYYLEKGKNFQTMLNLYADLIDYQYIPNGNYDLAEQILIKIENIEKSEGIQEPRMATTIYRIKGDFAYYSKDYERASQYYEEAIQIVNGNDYLQGFFMPIILIHKAKNLIELQKYSEAESILEEFIQNEDAFDNTDYSFEDVVKKLEAIPLYQTECCLYAHNQNYDKLKFSIEELIDHAYRQSFERMALATLQKLSKEYELPPEIESFVERKIDNLHSVIYIKDSKAYTELCNSQINSTVQALEEDELIRTEKQSTIVLVSSLFAACLVLSLLYMKIKRRSYIDELTGIYNRRYLTKKLAKNEKHHIPYSVIMFDIDNFKRINDTYGHDAGDIVLQGIGEILSYRCRVKTIEAFRYGGEEFTLLIYDGELLSPSTIAENIRHEIVAQKWQFNETVTVSIGVADKSTADKNLPILKQADIFLYYAKNHGKNQVCSGINGE